MTQCIISTLLMVIYANILLLYILGERVVLKTEKHGTRGKTHSGPHGRQVMEKVEEKSSITVSSDE